MRGEATVIGLRFVRKCDVNERKRVIGIGSVEWVQIGSAESVLESRSGVTLRLINSVAFMTSDKHNQCRDQESLGLGSADIVCER